MDETPAAHNPHWRGGIDAHSAVLDEQERPPEWIQLIPAGAFAGRDGRGPFRLDDPHGVIGATMALQMSAGIPIDYDHRPSGSGGPSGARGGMD